MSVDILGDGPRADRARDRLAGELIGWLTTVTPKGQPLSSPVWFWWDGETVLVYSRPDTAKLHNVARNPLVSVHLDGNGHGGDIVILEGRCRVDESRPPASEHDEFTAKYAATIERNGWTPATFGADYSVPMVVVPHRARIW